MGSSLEISGFYTSLSIVQDLGNQASFSISLQGKLVSTHKQCFPLVQGLSMCRVLYVSTVLPHLPSQYHVSGQTSRFVPSLTDRGSVMIRA